jgi:ParB-like chromosome segregation protein Spo0J
VASVARAAGRPSPVSAVQREASAAAAVRLALVEKLHRQDLSRQEQVAALDVLAAPVEPARRVCAVAEQ